MMKIKKCWKVIGKNYLNMIRNKLGEEKFNEYCKLIEKRSSSAEFTQPERFRLYELEKELRESH